MPVGLTTRLRERSPRTQRGRDGVARGAADVPATTHVCRSCSVAETDWRSELQTFQHGVEADTQRTAAGARAKSLEAVHTLGSLGALGGLTGDWAERVRERVRGGAALEGAPADPEASGGADGLDAARVAQSLTQARARASGWGRRVGGPARRTSLGCSACWAVNQPMAALSSACMPCAWVHSLPCWCKGASAWQGKSYGLSWPEDMGLHL